MPCPDCRNDCSSFPECQALQKFNQLVEHERSIQTLKKYIKKSVNYFSGHKRWLTTNPSEHYDEILFTPEPHYEEIHLPAGRRWRYRFMTITFDPKKFSFNELTQPDKLDNYVKNVLLNVKELFDGNIILVREYHKSGVPHYHLNYTPLNPDALEHLILRMRYYFSSGLINKYCIHDRIFNEGGTIYMQKYAKTYFQFKQYENYNPLEININEFLE